MSKTGGSVENQMAASVGPVERTIELLRDRNHCLEKYYWVNETEMQRMSLGQFDGVEEFYAARNQLLEAITVIDREVNLLNQQVAQVEIAGSVSAEVKLILQSKDDLVRSILAQDLKILSYVDKEKSAIILEMKAATKTKKAVGAYAHSERLKQLDQE